MTTKPKHPNITLSPVKSSQVEAIGFDNGTLAVKYKNGGLYHYHGVSAEDFAACQKCESIGKHLHAHIKPKFKFVKI